MTELLSRIRGTLLPWIGSRHIRGISGLDYVRASIVALALTLLGYLMWNTILVWQIDRTFAYSRLSQAERAANANEFINSLVREGVINPRPEIVAWCTSQLQENLSLPASAQFLKLADGIASPTDSVRRQRDTEIRRLMTGDRTGLPMLWLSADFASGEQIVRAMELSDGRRFESLLKQGEFFEERRATLVAFADRTALVVNGPIRDLRRYNGSIQWLTVFAFLVVAALCLQRFMLTRYLHHWIEVKSKPDPLLEQTSVPPLKFPNIVAQDPLLSQFSSPNIATTDRTQSEQAVQQLETEFAQGIHEPIGFLLGLIPSLGFVGTVMGMGEALLAADSLFSESDKQQAVALITQKLGFAFDTTLIALLLGMMGGGFLMILRYHERNFIELMRGRLGIPESATSAMKGSKS